MSYEIPHGYEAQIEHVAHSWQITTDEALSRILQAGLERITPLAESTPGSNVSLFGSVTGPGPRGSKEAVDRYLAELREEW